MHKNSLKKDDMYARFAYVTVQDLKQLNHIKDNEEFKEKIGEQSDNEESKE